MSRLRQNVLKVSQPARVLRWSIRGVLSRLTTTVQRIAVGEFNPLWTSASPSASLAPRAVGVPSEFAGGKIAPRRTRCSCSPTRVLADGPAWRRLASRCVFFFGLAVFRDVFACSSSQPTTCRRSAIRGRIRRSRPDRLIADVLRSRMILSEAVRLDASACPG